MKNYLKSNHYHTAKYILSAGARKIVLKGFHDSK